MATARGLTAQLLAHALKLPEAWEDHPWGENVAKVGKKVFVFFGVPDPRSEELGLCVKLPQSGLAALERGIAEPAGYGLGKSGWVAAKFKPSDAPDMALLQRWIEESYRAVAPKKLVAQLDGGAPVTRKATAARTKRKPTARAAGRTAKKRTSAPAKRRRG